MKRYASRVSPVFIPNLTIGADIETDHCFVPWRVSEAERDHDKDDRSEDAPGTYSFLAFPLWSDYCDRESLHILVMDVATRSFKKPSRRSSTLLCTVQRILATAREQADNLLSWMRGTTSPRSVYLMWTVSKEEQVHQVPRVHVARATWPSSSGAHATNHQGGGNLWEYKNLQSRGHHHSHRDLPFWKANHFPRPFAGRQIAVYPSTAHCKAQQEFLGDRTRPVISR